MLCFTCSMISSIDLALYKVFHAQDLGIWEINVLQSVLHILFRGECRKDTGVPVQSPGSFSPTTFLHMPSLTSTIKSHLILPFWELIPIRCSSHTFFGIQFLECKIFITQFLKCEIEWSTYFASYCNGRG